MMKRSYFETVGKCFIVKKALSNDKAFLFYKKHGNILLCGGF